MRVQVAVFNAASIHRELLESSTVLGVRDSQAVSKQFGIDFIALISDSADLQVANELGVVVVSNCTVTSVEGIVSGDSGAKITLAADFQGELLSQVFIGIVVIHNLHNWSNTAVEVRSCGTQAAYIPSGAALSQPAEHSVSPLPLVAVHACAVAGNVSLSVVGLKPKSSVAYDALVALIDVHRANQTSATSPTLMAVVITSIPQQTDFVVKHAVVVCNSSDSIVSFYFANVSYASHRDAPVAAPLLNALDGVVALTQLRLANLRDNYIKLTISCVMRDEEYIPYRRVAMPQDLFPRIGIDDTCASAESRTVVVALRPPGSASLLPSSVAVVIALGAVVPPAAVWSVASLQVSQRAIQLRQLCQSDGAESTDELASSVLDNPLQLRLTGAGVPPSAASAVGSIVGNAVLLAAYTTVVVITTFAHRVGVQGHPLQLRLFQRAFSDSGGFVAAYLAPYWIVAQPLSTAVAGLFALAVVIDAHNAVAPLVLSACTGLVFVGGPAAAWLYRVLWVWRNGRCPYHEQLQQLPVLPRAAPSGGLLETAACTVRHLVRRVLHPTGAETMWAPRRSVALSRNDGQYLIVVKHYRLHSRWFLAVDVGLVLLSGAVGGISWAISDCEWSLWVLLALVFGHCVVTGVVRPFLSRVDTVLCLVLELLGTLSIALSVADKADAAADVALVQCVVSLVSPLLSILDFCTNGKRSPFNEKTFTVGRATPTALHRPHRNHKKRDTNDRHLPARISTSEALHTIVTMICLHTATPAPGVC